MENDFLINLSLNDSEARQLTSWQVREGACAHHVSRQPVLLKPFKVLNEEQLVYGNAVPSLGKASCTAPALTKG